MMKICASFGTPEIDRSAELADMIEIRTDVFSEIPDTGKDTIITLDDISKLSMVPDGFRGMVDVGTAMPPKIGAEIISSYHDHEMTPADIVSILGPMKGDVLKGSFLVNEIRDLVRIYDASKKIDRRHVLIGMGELGKITRIRQNVLGNEFTFAYAGTPTAPGQMSVGEMRSLGDDCLITGLLGTPLTDASRKMHDSAFAYGGINGKYLLFDTPSIDGISEMVRAYDIRGVNVTIPYKTEIIRYLDGTDQISEAAGSVNTVLNDNGKLIGYNTDVHGIDTAFEGHDLKSGRALIIGTGGASRSCIYSLQRKGCDVAVTGRNNDAGALLSRKFGCRFIPVSSIPLKMFDVIVNCTPVTDGSLIDMTHLDREQIVFDMIHYTETDLQKRAKKLGCSIIDSKDMLASQAAESFRIWTGRKIPFNVMRGFI